MIDTHCHLDQLAEPEAVMTRCLAEGLSQVIAPAMGEDSLGRLLALTGAFPGKISVAAGVHPERPMTPLLLEEAHRVAQWIDENHGRIIAIGEVGLPSYNLPASGRPDPVAFEILDLFLERAVRWDLPVILHAVHASALPCLERLRAMGVRRAVFHWLKAPEAVQARIAAEGYYASVTPEVETMPRDQTVARRFFPRQLLVETDGPEPLRVTRQGPSTPLWVADGIVCLAERFHCTVEEMEERMDENARTFFRL